MENTLNYCYVIISILKMLDIVPDLVLFLVFVSLLNFIIKSLNNSELNEKLVQEILIFVHSKKNLFRSGIQSYNKQVHGYIVIRCKNF